jgi:hypothetical protein
MPRVTWLLEHDCPVVKIELVEPLSGARITRTLLADTGAGSRTDPFELILSESDCQQYLGLQSSDVVGLGGAITGTHPIYSMWVEISALSFARRVNVVAVPAAACPAGLDGFACFRFLNAFTYGNFGNGNQFGLEM